MIFGTARCSCPLHSVAVDRSGSHQIIATIEKMLLLVIVPDNTDISLIDLEISLIVLDKRSEWHLMLIIIKSVSISC